MLPLAVVEEEVWPSAEIESELNSVLLADREVWPSDSKRCNNPVDFCPKYEIEM